MCVCVQEEQAAKLKADNIRVALEKIKEAQVKKVSQEKKKKAAEICVVYLCVCVWAMCLTMCMCLFVCASVSSTCPTDSVFWVRSVLLHIESSGQ